jgi:hypothetical protein
MQRAVLAEAGTARCAITIPSNGDGLRRPEMNIPANTLTDNPARLAELLRRFEQQHAEGTLEALHRGRPDAELADFLVDAINNRRPWAHLVYAIMCRLEISGALPALAAPVPLGGLTKHQATALKFIRRFVAERGHSPSYSEIAAALNMKSKSGVPPVLKRLVARGFLERGAGHERAVKITPAGLAENLGE